MTTTTAYTTFSWAKGMTYAEEPVAAAANAAAAAAAAPTTPAPPAPTTSSHTLYTTAPPTTPTTTTKQESNVCIDKSPIRRSTSYPPQDMRYPCNKLKQKKHECIKGSKYKDLGPNASVLNSLACDSSDPDHYYQEHHPGKKDSKTYLQQW